MKHAYRFLWAALVVAATSGFVPALAAASSEPLPVQRSVEDTPSLTTSEPTEPRTDEVLRARAMVELRTEQVDANAKAVQEILDIGLASSDAGELLREARQRAPDPHQLSRQFTDRERQTAEARLDRVRLLEQRRLSDDAAETERLGRELARQEVYLEAMDGLLAAERSLLDKARELVALLDSQLLWIGSAPAIGADWPASVTQGALWIIDPEEWLDLSLSMRGRITDQLLQCILFVLLVGTLTVMRRQMRRELPELGKGVGKIATDSFLLTARALLFTLLLALVVPLWLAGAGLLLRTKTLGPLAQALGSGLVAAAAVYVALDFSRLMCKSGGLADAHFGWNGRARRILARNLRWLVVVQVIAAFLVATTDASRLDVCRWGLGRLAFMFGALGLSVFAARVFRPHEGVFSELMSRTGWPWRLRRLWYPLLVLLPAGLAAASAAGYLYTAIEIQSRFFTSGLVVLAGIVSFSMLERWLLVTRRRLAVAQARAKLAQLREARQRRAAEDGTDEAASGEATPDLDLQKIDVAAASAQTLALLRTLAATVVLMSLWAVWRDLLPALGVLEGIPLTKPTLDSAGQVIVPPITLWSLLLALLAGVLTLVAARNLPAMLELILLTRFSIDSGTRYAAATLVRYAVYATGAVVASKWLGIDWSRAQWIIAALGVGLGFGLQEIVANFVSGLIILFERPIRVGDTVTVGDVSGTVSRLQIRATTITDWDNKEILVPNKGFITEQVINWTLTSPVTRLIVSIGVAYGSDEVLAREAITKAVKSVATVLEQPAPSVLFIRFGESSLDFEVRAFVAELSNRLTTLHDLNCAISAALRDAGIEIPFPQRDLHLRSSDVELVRGGGDGGAGD